MSEEAKKVILKEFVEEENFDPVNQALEITKIYANSNSAVANQIPRLFEHLVHLFTTGDRIR